MYSRWIINSLKKAQGKPSFMETECCENFFVKRNITVCLCSFRSSGSMTQLHTGWLQPRRSFVARPGKFRSRRISSSTQNFRSNIDITQDVIEAEEGFLFMLDGCTIGSFKMSSFVLAPTNWIPHLRITVWQQKLPTSSFARKRFWENRTSETRWRCL